MSIPVDSVYNLKVDERPVMEWSKSKEEKPCMKCDKATLYRWTMSKGGVEMPFCTVECKEEWRDGGVAEEMR